MTQNLNVNIYKKCSILDREVLGSNPTTLVYQIRVPHQITAYRGTNLAICYIKMQEIAHFLPIWMTK